MVSTRGDVRGCREGAKPLGVASWLLALWPPTAKTKLRVNRARKKCAYIGRAALLLQSVLAHPGIVNPFLLFRARRQLDDLIVRGDATSELDVERSQVVVAKNGQSNH